MTVRLLLRDKGTAASTARPDTKVQEIMDQFERDEVSAVVVTHSDSSILGIVSGGDILRALNRDGPSVLKSSVSDVMTTEVFTCDVSEPLSKVYEMMNTNQIRHVPIVEDSELCGIINTLDVVKYRLREIACEADALKDYVAGRG
jgi:CBS domain-containing protein